MNKDEENKAEDFSKNVLHENLEDSLEEKSEGISITGDLNSDGNILLGNRNTVNNFNIIINGLSGYVPSPDLSLLRKKYLTHLYNTYHAIDFRGISQLSTINQELLLEDIYVPLLARPNLSSTEMSERQVQEHKPDNSSPSTTKIDANVRAGVGKGTNITVNIEDTLGIHSKILILGHPGSGKSTILKYIALKLATQENSPLPILIPLNAYAAKLKGEDCSLQDYFAQYFKSSSGSFAGIESLFNSAIQQGRAIVLLDGLDEVQKDRPWIINKIEMLSNDIALGGNKILLTSRIDSYRETPLLGDWAVYTLLDFDRPAIEAFSMRWCLAVEKASRGNTPEAYADAKKEQKNLLFEIDSKPKVAQLASKPLLLTILALIQRQRTKLPKSRVKLYNIYLETIISTWNQHRALNGKPITPDEDEDNSYEYEYEEVVAILGPLALWLREENPSSWLVSEDKLIGWLANYYKREQETNPMESRRRARKFFNQIKKFTNIFVEQGDDSVEFIHGTFGEALAAFGLTSIGSDFEEGWQIIQKHLLDSAWQEVVLLFVATYGVIKFAPKTASEIVNKILDQERQGNDEGRNVLIAGACLEEVGEQSIVHSVSEKVKLSLIKLSQKTSVPLATRRDAGFLLGRIGWKPEDLDQFILIKIDPLLNTHVAQDISKEFSIGKYPVTNLQFRRFIEDGGYQNLEYWSEPGINWLTGNTDDEYSPLYFKLTQRSDIKRPTPYFWHDPFWNNPLSPVVGINWFEAEAYCRWLSTKNKGVFRLPSEGEWEYASCGSNGFEYPWGGGFKPSMANTAESWWVEEIPFNIRQWLYADSISRKNASTTIVGQFPESNTLTGICDMAGNVWEWTDTWFDESRTNRVTRGGSWIGKSSYARCKYRGQNAPLNYANYLGFRVVRSHE
jgi:formylglycine-generating enzyme required for sulfatase activity